MIENPTQIQVLLERCITDNSDAPWSAFLSTFGPLLRRVYHAHADARGFPEFEKWFPGWLFYERKLHAAYRGLLAKIQCGECRTADTQERYFENYFANIVRTAVTDFRQEGHRKVHAQVADSFLTAIPATPPLDDDDLSVCVLGILAKLAPELRVPFHLRYFLALGPLTEADAEWVAECAGIPAARVAELVAEEAVTKRSHQKPLSSEFIGNLLRIPPSADGKYSTVDQRVRRAVLKIREHLSQTAERGTE